MNTRTQAVTACRSARTWAVLGAAVSFALAACGTDEVVGDPGAVDGALVEDATAGDLALAEAGPAGETVAAPGADVAPVDSAPVDTGPTGCPGDHCLIAGTCLANGTTNPANPCQRCVALASTATWSADDAATCDDGKACSLGDHCDAGACVGKAKDCGDGNGCTADSCGEKGACVYLPVQATCADGDACTVGDACKDGACAGGGAKLPCEDGNPCTTDACDPKTGCTFTVNTAACDDGSACTLGDACKDAVCLPGAVTSCDDANLCTVDSCNAKKGCQHASVASLCTDSNPCTDEACDPKQGCVFPYNTIPCNDQNFCTAADTCTKGACLGAAVNPDDGNLCTDDACNPKVGPVHVANTVPCDDSDACTLEDTCGGSKCLPGKKPLACDDKNGCTDDSCDPKKGCVLAANTTPCDDASACTKNDTCAATLCSGVTVDCDDGNACTTDSCDIKSGCKNALMASKACRPAIEVTYPPRAATVQQAAPTITVKGTVKSGAGPIKAFTLNGQAVTVGADGSFSVANLSQPGGNTLVFEATDSFGSSKKRVQAYLWSKDYFKPVLGEAGTGMVDPGLGFWLGQAVIDSGVHDLKKPADLATIFEIVVKGIDVGSLLPNPVYSAGDAKVVLSNLKYDPAKVSLTSQPGSLRLVATIANLSSDLVATYKLCLPFLGCNNLNVGGKMTLTSIVISSDMVITVKADHTLAVKLTNTTVDLNGMKITFNNNAVNFLIGGLTNTLISLFKNQLQATFASQIAASLEPTLASALGALAIKTSFDVAKLDGSGGKVTVFLDTDFSAVTIDTPGAQFDLRARATALKAVKYDNLGVPARNNCGSGLQKLVVLKKSPLELVVADDAFNELLYATWLGGLFEFPVPATMLGSVELSSYGVSDLKMKVSAMLAPTMADCNADGKLFAHIGDFRIDATLKLFGQEMDLVMYATFTAGVQVVAKDGKLGISLDKVEKAELQIDVQQDNLVASEGVLEKLVKENLLTGLIGQLGGNALGAFPIPAIDLSAAAKLPPGTAVLAIKPSGVERKAGNSIVGGSLQ